MHTVAYLDANSGSLIAGALAAGFAGVAVVFKMGWQRVLAVVSPKHRRALKARRAAEAEAAAQADTAQADAAVKTTAGKSPAA